MTPGIATRQAERKQWLSAVRTTQNQPIMVMVSDNSTGRLAENNDFYKIKANSLGDASRQVSFLDSALWTTATGAIIIDVKGSLAELEQLAASVKSKTNCLVFINKNLLDKNHIKFLKNFELIDDAVDLESPMLAAFITNRCNKRSQPLKDSLRKQKRAIKSVRKSDVRNAAVLFKVALDSMLAALIILMLLPVIALIALAIRLDSKGPIFYSSLRAGRGYRIFKFYKFRSMVVDADKKIENLAHLNQYDSNDQGPKFFKLNNDPRVTPIGKFLRNTSLDELPQLFNVLIGDMQLVGNRPLPLYEAETLTTNEYVERFCAPAGITGYWQIKKRGKAEMSVKERMELDIYYSKKSSPLLDLYIIARTPAALFQKSDV